MSSEARGAADRRRELVSRMLRQRGLEDGRDAIPRRPDPSEHPLSFAQQRLWFLDQLEPGSPRYNMFVAYRLEGTLDAPALERTLAEILRRHEVLRARFTAKDGEPRVHIAPPGPLPMARHDLEGRGAAERDARIEDLALEHARRPYDLAGGPLVRAALLRLGPREHLLLLGMHHVVSDGWSAGVLTRELCALYEAFSQGLPSPLPELAVQYADFAAWQRQSLRGEVLDGQVAYWRRQLEGLTTLELPTDRPRPPVQTFAGAWRFRALPPGLVDRVRDLGQREGATLFMTLLAAYAAVLSRLQRPGRCRDRRSHREPHARRARGPDRLLREHPRAPERPLGRPELPRAVAPGPRDGGLLPTRTRTSRSRSWSRSSGRSGT